MSLLACVGDNVVPVIPRHCQAGALARLVWGLADRPRSDLQPARADIPEDIVEGWEDLLRGLMGVPFQGPDRPLLVDFEADALREFEVWYSASVRRLETRGTSMDRLLRDAEVRSLDRVPGLALAFTLIDAVEAGDPIGEGVAIGPDVLCRAIELRSALSAHTEAALATLRA
ncbi:hypothetical protein OJF2_14070 [Aquisphaera giovannonii]|uniref:Uncharacterized protein n=1 Tax=Aquisphaera giovannonii TaxID=406548 RepID=A0A5B9VXC7_9BACT|nr:hypothetical protein OJF2_14070 [Aquisphaera giovannonii]